ncbi:MAG: phage tail tape measure protein [Candidatus Pacebacteria bacterium]|nr:phage tail tape measure protein [Candidatus Paceibacterota bacterium]
MPFYLGNEPEWCKRFFEDTLPCVKYLKESKTYEVYDSTYKFYGFMGDTRQKHLDSMFITMCSPSARPNPGDSIKVIYLNTKNPDVFNYDLRVGYYNGKVSGGLVWYQIKNSKLFGRYKIEGNNTTIEDDPFDVTVKSMIGYESVRRKLAKLVTPAKTITTPALAYTEEKKKDGKVVVKILQDGEPAFAPQFDSIKYKDSVVRRITFVRDSTQKVKTADSVRQARIAFVADSTKNAKNALAVEIANAEKRARVADSIKNAKKIALELNKTEVQQNDQNLLAEVDSALARTRRYNQQFKTRDSLKKDELAKQKNLLELLKTARLDSIKNAKAEALAQLNQKRLDSLQKVNEKKDREKQLASQLYEQKRKNDSITKKAEANARLLAEVNRQLAVKNEQLLNEIAKQRMADSIRNEKYADSLAFVRVTDSTNKSLREIAYADSVRSKRTTDSIAQVKRTADSTAFVINELKRKYDSVAFVNQSLHNVEIGARKVTKKEYVNEEDEKYAKSDLPEVTLENGKLKIIPPEGGSDNPAPPPLNVYKPKAKLKPPPVIIIYKK